MEKLLKAVLKAKWRPRLSSSAPSWAGGSHVPPPRCSWITAVAVEQRPDPLDFPVQDQVRGALAVVAVMMRLQPVEARAAERMCTVEREPVRHRILVAARDARAAGIAEALVVARGREKATRRS